MIQSLLVHINYAAFQLVILIFITATQDSEAQLKKQLQLIIFTKQFPVERAVFQKTTKILEVTLWLCEAVEKKTDIDLR